MKRSYIFVAALAVAGLVGLQTAQAGVITAPDITSGSSSYTTADTLVTLTPYASVTNGGTVGTLGAGGSWFGVGTGNKIVDTDGDPATTGDRQAIDISLAGTVGLSQFSIIYSRADGPLPTDGIAISGFIADPVASGGTYDIGTGTLYIQTAWTGATILTYDMDNISASLGQTLRVSVNDSNEIGPQVAINTISYAIPEPATLGLVAMMGGGLLFIRRRFQM